MKSSFHTIASAAAILSLALAGAAWAQQGTDKAPDPAQGPRAGQQHEGHGGHAQGGKGDAAQGHGHGMGQGMHHDMGHGRGMGMGRMGGMHDHAAMHQGMAGQGGQEQGGTWGGARPKQQ